MSTDSYVVRAGEQHLRVDVLAEDERDPTRSWTPVPLDLLPALQALPGVAAALMSSGQLVRIIGPDPLLKGLAKGTLRQLTTDDGVLTTVVDSATGTIKGQLRVEDVSSFGVNAAAVFQVASAVTLQYYLHEINGQLANLESSMGHLIDRAQNAGDADLESARRELRRLAGLRSRGISLGDRDWERVQQAIDAVTEQAEESSANVAPLVRAVGVVRAALADVVADHETEVSEAASGSSFGRRLVDGVSRGRGAVVDQGQRVLRARRLTSAIDDLDAAAGRHTRDVKLLFEASALRAELFSALLAAERPEQRVAALAHAHEEVADAQRTLRELGASLSLPESDSEVAALAASVFRGGRQAPEVARARMVAEQMGALAEALSSALDEAFDERPYVMELTSGDDGTILAVVESMTHREQPATP